MSYASFTWMILSRMLLDFISLRSATSMSISYWKRLIHEEKYRFIRD